MNATERSFSQTGSSEPVSLYHNQTEEPLSSLCSRLINADQSRATRALIIELEQASQENPQFAQAIFAPLITREISQLGHNNFQPELFLYLYRCLSSEDQSLRHFAISFFINYNFNSNSYDTSFKNQFLPKALYEYVTSPTVDDILHIINNLHPVLSTLKAQIAVNLLLQFSENLQPQPQPQLLPEDLVAKLKQASDSKPYTEAHDILNQALANLGKANLLTGHYPW